MKFWGQYSNYRTTVINPAHHFFFFLGGGLDKMTATCKIHLSPMANCTKTDFLFCTLIIIKASRTVQMVNSTPVQFFFLFTSFVLTVVFRRPSDMEGGMDRLCMSCCTSSGSFNISFIVKSTLQKWT